jgi:CheY-like chemotaxis protein
MESKETAYVAVIVRDLIFASRIREAAKRNGVRLEFVKPGPGFADRLAPAPPAFFIVDLGAKSLDPFAVINEIRETPALSGARVIGFLPHVETGYDLVAPRSWMALNVEQMFADFAAGKPFPVKSGQ